MTEKLQPKTTTIVHDKVESEAFAGLYKLFDKYKMFAFNVITRLPYSSVSAWVKFTNGNIEEALKEERSVKRNVLDTYVIMIFELLLSLISVWFFLLLLASGAILIIFGLLQASVIETAVLMSVLSRVADIALWVAILIVLLPVVSLFVNTALYYILAKLLGGKGSFKDTMSVLVLGSSSHLILLIPLILSYIIIIGYVLSPLAYVIILYMLYLVYKGIMYVHGLSPKRSVAVIIGAIVIEVGILLTIGVGLWENLKSGL